MRIQDHPTYKAIQQDVAAANALAEQERQAEQMEAARLRQEQGQHLVREFAQRVQEYERMRVELHQQLGAIWTAANQYSHLTGELPSTFPEAMFTSTHIPSLSDPAAYNLSPGFTTTRASVAHYFATMGKSW